MPARCFSRHGIFAQHGDGLSLRATGQRARTGDPNQCTFDTGERTSFLPQNTPIDAVYDIRQGKYADLATQAALAPKCPPQSPFGSSGARFGTRYDGSADYYLNSSQRYFGKNEIFEDMSFILSNPATYSHVLQSTHQLLSQSPASSRTTSPGVSPTHAQQQTLGSGFSAQADSFASTSGSQRPKSRSAARLDSAVSMEASVRAFAARQRADLRSATVRARAAQHAVLSPGTDEQLLDAVSSGKQFGVRSFWDDPIHSDVPSRMKRRLKRMEEDEKGTAFGASGDRFGKSFLGMDTRRMAESAHMGPGMYEKADPLQFEQTMHRMASVSRDAHAGSSREQGRNQPGSIWWDQHTPAATDYERPVVLPKPRGGRFSLADRFGADSAGQVSRQQHYVLTGQPQQCTSDFDQAGLRIVKHEPARKGKQARRPATAPATDASAAGGAGSLGDAAGLGSKAGPAGGAAAAASVAAAAAEAARPHTSAAMVRRGGARPPSRVPITHTMAAYKEKQRVVSATAGPAELMTSPILPNVTAHRPRSPPLHTLHGQFHEVEHQGRSPFFSPAGHGKTRPYANARDVVRPAVFHYSTQLPVRPGLAETLANSRTNPVKSGMSGTSPRITPYLGAKMSATHMAGIDPGHYHDAPALNTTFRTPPASPSMTPVAKNSHWLRHTDRHANVKLRYG